MIKKGRAAFVPKNGLWCQVWRPGGQRGGTQVGDDASLDGGEDAWDGQKQRDWRGAPWVVWHPPRPPPRQAHHGCAWPPDF